MVADLGDRGGDSTRLEVTAAAEGVPSLAKTLCAFGNMPEGGTVILGLDEVGGFAPVRITNITALEHGVAAQAREAVAPAVSCEFETVHVAGNPVLAVTVAGLPLSQRLARHRGKAYLRQADGDYEMSEQELAQLELLTTQPSDLRILIGTPYLVRQQAILTPVWWRRSLLRSRPPRADTLRCLTRRYCGTPT